VRVERLGPLDFQRHRRRMHRSSNEASESSATPESLAETTKVQLEGSTTKRSAVADRIALHRARSVLKIAELLDFFKPGQG
jgi:hypothetical protein